ncbi:MAG: tRNA uridine-5-carboxymethylaminomethyl(34) synthesis GTPase MnmE [Bacilli bacterium]
MEDTIVAISTALGKGAISIIRVSGNKSIEIVNKIFKNKDLTKVKSHTIHYGYIYENDELIDQVLVSVMKNPKTYTKEDIVEINCHGGISTTNKVLELVLNNGARLAEPGEFTKRALLNGRIDLVEAEGVMDLINSKTNKARKLALNQVEGNLSLLIKHLRKEILEIIANIEVNIDYPEYEDALIFTNKILKQKINKFNKKINLILKESENSKIIKEGIKTVIIGRPNVGKSSILNKLIGEEKAIVTNIEGTTRDIVEGEINIGGILLNIIDTAGIRETNNIIEKKGVEKSLKLIEEAELIIVVFDNNKVLTKKDLSLLNLIENKRSIVFINKNDLNKKIDRSKLTNKIVVEGNTIKENGLLLLKNKIKEMFNLDLLEQKDLTYLSNARQISLVKKVLRVIQEIEEAIQKEMPVDMIEIDLKEIFNLLGEIIGENYNDELLNEIFQQFCLGK